MTATERAKRSDALYYETVSVTRRVLCDMVANREADLGELKAENAKLRELAKGMYGMLATVDAILGNHDACETPRPLIFGENKSFKDAMRELGVDA